MKELRKYLVEADSERKKVSKKLKEVERIIKKVEAKEIEGNLNLLKVRKKQIEEELQLIEAKIALISMIIMIRENIELYYRLYGKDNFEKLLNEDIYRVNRELLHELERIGIKEINVNTLYEYFDKEFQKKKEEEKEEEKKKKKEEGEKGEEKLPVPLMPSLLTSVEYLNKLLREGSVEEWVDLIKKSVDKNEKIMLPLIRNPNSEGYRNLLIAVYTMNINSAILKEIITDRFIVRAVDYLKDLVKGKTIEVAPDSSDKDYIDQLLQIMCNKPVKEESTEIETIKHYKLALSNREVLIEKKTLKDPVTRKAQKITYKVIT